MTESKETQEINIDLRIAQKNEVFLGVGSGQYDSSEKNHNLQSTSVQEISPDEKNINNILQFCDAAATVFSDENNKFEDYLKKLQVRTVLLT